jgi:leucine-zipper-like transcriptional regulator 1
MNKLRIIVMAMSFLFLGHIARAQVGANWTQATNAAPWAGRENIGCTSFNGQMWVMGGRANGVYLNDVWSSSNGVTWTQATSAAPWSTRMALGCATFNGQIWVMGGYGGGFNYYNDVWSSSDGATWTEVTNAAPWCARNFAGVVTLNGQMWVMGGYGVCGGGFLNDVWSSSDGVTWTQATSAAPWSGRQTFGCTTLNGQMWVMGGTDGYNNFFNDVWLSSDGVTWTEATSAAQWGGRELFGCTTLDGQMWVLGGDTNAASYSPFLNDVWSSSNGVTWTEVTSAAPWSGRDDFGCATLNEQVWVMGGRDSNTNDLNDVWMTPLPGCDITQLVPCAGPLSGGTWKNHAAYVRSVIGAASACLRGGLITPWQWAEIVTRAAHSRCGWNPQCDQPWDPDWNRDWNWDQDGGWHPHD